MCKKIANHYIYMDQVLGRGSFGAVYLARNIKNEQFCAVKIISKTQLERQEQEQLKISLDNEISTHISLSSPHIVRFLGLEESQNNYYILMELCDSDLAKELSQKKKFNEEKAIEYFKQIVKGYEALYKKNIIHRDLKPANLLIADGKIKICDFGLSKATNVTNSVVGTPIYRSPQILRGKSYTNKCDVWAVGCILYQMLHGKTPWTESIETNKVMIDEKVSQQVHRLLLSCLELDDKNRISWQELFKYALIGQTSSEGFDAEQCLQRLKSNMLRFKIDINSLLQRLSNPITSQITRKQFRNVVYFINKKVTQEQSSEIFDLMGQSGNVVKIAKVMALMGVQSSAMDTTKEIPQEVKEAFQKLRAELTIRKIKLIKVFNHYSKKQSNHQRQCLDIKQFTAMALITKIVTNQSQIPQIFAIIDKDCSQSIEFEELLEFYCKANGLDFNKEKSLQLG